MPTTRRAFLGTAGLALLRAADSALPSTLIGGARQDSGDAPLPGAQWYVAEKTGAGLSCSFPPGTLSQGRFLTSEMLLDGDVLAVFELLLHEAGSARTFQLVFGALNQCSLRVRLPLAAVDQNRWMLGRQGAFLKAQVEGDRVDLAKVDRLELKILRKNSAPVRWSMTPLRVVPGDLPPLTQPVLPKGKLLDEMGQSRLREWPSKSRSVDEVTRRIRTQLEEAPRLAWPEGFSRWGGSKARRLAPAGGFFRTHHDGRRWWLVDPDGYAFWSAGADCVRVDTDANYAGLESALAWLPEVNPEFRDMFPREGKSINYLAGNFIRALGAGGWRDKWAQIALAQMKRLRFNTVGNWSEWQFARRASFPYVRPLDFRPARSGSIYRDFPDVFHARFEQDAADFASQLAETRDDPALIGYFLMNEPTWGFSTEVPAAGMLYNTESCATRQELAAFLKRKYPDDAALSTAWKTPATFERIARGRWQGALTKEAAADLRDFSVLMVERYFQTLSKACRQVDARHLNLGMRWAGVPPEWAVRGMKVFDVFSLNCYELKLPLEQAAKIHEMLKVPVMVGEWHFGALDAGLPASGLGHVRNQHDRGRAYRTYLEDAAADPYCVGAHWFTLYDQSALGRFDGENFNIGFLDVCNRPYEEIGNAAIASHESVYEVASGSRAPFRDAPEYLPELYS